MPPDGDARVTTPPAATTRFPSLTSRTGDACAASSRSLGPTRRARALWRAGWRAPGSAPAPRCPAASGPCATCRRVRASTTSTSSAKLTSRISSRRARMRGSVTRSIASTRRSRLRGIRSAEPMTYSVLSSPGVPETEDARVLEVAADDRAHRDVLRQAGHAGAQAADAADDQVDPRARRRRRVQVVDDLGVDERVHLHRDRPAGVRLRRG